MKNYFYYFGLTCLLLFTSFKKKDNINVVKISDKLYASETEVSNGEYKEFLDYLKQNDIAGYKKYNVDSNQWRDELAYNEPYVIYYFRHPSYVKYPVVNVSHDGAMAYCKWLTEKYHAKENRKFKKVLYRLPTEKEWMLAARGGLDSNSIFPWKGTSLRNNKKGQWYGGYLCNYKRINEACLKKVGNRTYTVECSMNFGSNAGLNSNAEITAPVRAFLPNGFGLYNMSGNVAEMLQEKGRTKGGSWNSTDYYVRLDTEDEFAGWEKPSPMIGFRVFMEVIVE